MIFELYIVIAFFAVVTLLYAVFYRDTENFSHIISEFFSAIIFLGLGYQAYSGIQFPHVTETETYAGGVITATTELISLETYQYPWLAGLLIIVGVIVALHTFVQALNENADMIKNVEDEKGNFHDNNIKF